nr:YdcF family protein [Clostridium thermobutyricum]
MKNYLIDKGIDKDRIIEENKSITTVQNIVNSYKILKELGAGNEPILIVSNEFHLYRAQLIADLLGIKNSGIACNSNLR